MAAVPPAKRERDEIARRGDEIYDSRVRPHLGPGDKGKFVLIDIESGDHELDRDEIAASDHLLARHPDARVWMVQVGSQYARYTRHLWHPRSRFDDQATSSPSPLCTTPLILLRYNHHYTCTLPIGHGSARHRISLHHADGQHTIGP